MIKAEPKIYATDVVYLTHEQDKTLIDLWERNEKPTDERFSIPADLFFAKTLPLHNFDVYIDERDMNDGFMTKVCFRLSDSEMNGIPRIVQNPQGLSIEIKHVLNVMAICRDVQRIFMAYVGIMDECDYLVCFAMQMMDQFRIKNLSNEEIANLHLSDLIGCYLETWYGIEIAMLHPTVKEIFQHPKMKKERISKAERKDNDNKVYRYVRHHYIKTDELETAIYGKHSINRKALIWYVTGHWREYRKTGKKIFIQPYWKGALRETKQAKPRNREIILEEG